MPDVLYKQDNTKVVNHNKDEKELTDSLFAEIKSKFDWFNEIDHRAVSDKYTHEILGNQVIRTCVMLPTAEAMVGKRLATAHRLFDVDTNTSMLYSTILFADEQPSWAHPDMFIIGVTEHYEEYNKPVNPDMLTFKEYFFVTSTEGAQTLGLDLTGVNHDTVFSALVKDDQVVAYRRYSNFVETDTGVLANWQMAYVVHAKLARRMDLVRALFANPFIEVDV